jgi:hypothetical protein
MKIANVVEVRDIDRASEPTPQPDRLSRRGRVEQLLARYPRISEAETSEVRNFLATAGHLDVGLVAGNEALSANLAAFRKDHARHFRPKLHELALFLLVTAGPVAALFWRYLGQGG